MRASEDSPERYVERVRAQYPHLPPKLTLELERKHLATLQGWFDRVRTNWNKKPAPEDNVLAEANPLRTLDEAQMGPVLLALDQNPMTEAEQTAWNELYAMLCPLMVGIAYRQYDKRVRFGSKMTLSGVLNYSALAFLYALSGYDPDGIRKGGKKRGNKHKNDFSQSDKPRLITWIRQDAGRYIRRYLEHYGHSIRQGSGHTIAERGRAVRAAQRFEAREGYRPQAEQLSAELRKDGDKTAFNAADKIDEMGLNFLTAPQTQNISAPSLSGDDPMPLVDLTPAPAEDVTDLYDPLAYAERRATSERLRLLVRKLLLSEEPLNDTDRSVLGLNA